MLNVCLLIKSNQATSHKLYKWHAILAGNLILVSKFLLCSDLCVFKQLHVIRPLYYYKNYYEDAIWNEAPKIFLISDQIALKMSLSNTNNLGLNKDKFTRADCEPRTS